MTMSVAATDLSEIFFKCLCFAATSHQTFLVVFIFPLFNASLDDIQQSIFHGNVALRKSIDAVHAALQRNFHRAIFWTFNIHNTVSSLSIKICNCKWQQKCYILRYKKYISTYDGLVVYTDASKLSATKNRTLGIFSGWIHIHGYRHLVNSTLHLTLSCNQSVSQPVSAAKFNAAGARPTLVILNQ